MKCAALVAIVLLGCGNDGATSTDLAEAKLSPAGGGAYRGMGQVMMAGRWDATVTVMRGGQRLGSKQLPVVAR